MGCGTSKSAAPLNHAEAPERQEPTTTHEATHERPRSDSGASQSTAVTRGGAERLQDVPPGWLPSIDTDTVHGEEAKELRDALFGDDDDNDGSLQDNHEIRARFDRYDSNKSGNIERGELRMLLADTLSLSLEQVDEYATHLFNRLDAIDGVVDGKIEFKAFRKLHRRLLATEVARRRLVVKVLAKAGASESTKERAAAVFAKHDKDGSGSLSLDELSSLLREALGSDLAATISEKTDWGAFVTNTMARGDKDLNGEWDAAEFANYFGKCLAHPCTVDAYAKKITMRLHQQEGSITLSAAAGAEGAGMGTADGTQPSEWREAA